jgi:hypothetical protein
MIEDAVCDQITGGDAVLELLSLHEGSFIFEPEKVEKGTISLPIRQVLMEAIRRMDEKAAGLR